MQSETNILVDGDKSTLKEIDGDTEKPKMLEKSAYLYPGNMAKFMHKKFGLFGLIAGFYYCIQFIMAVSACNFYSDASRLSSCIRESDSAKLSGEDASQVLDTAIYLGGVFHIAEWIRSTILLVIILVGVNLMQVWYITAVTALYGIAAFFYIMVVVASADAKACAAS